MFDFSLVFDYNNSIGWGHKTRMESLAAYMDIFNISYVMCPNLFYRFVVGSLRKDHILSELNISKGIILDISAKEYVIHQFDLLISFISMLKDIGKIVIVLDGLFKHDSIHRNSYTDADLIIVPYFFSREFKFRLKDNQSGVFGEEYFIYNPVINDMIVNCVDKHNYILLSFGRDVDFECVKKILETISSSHLVSKYRIKLIYSGLGCWEKNDKIEIMKPLNHINFLFLVSKAAVLVTSTGLTKYEALALKTPVVVFDPNNHYAFYYRQLEKILPLKYCISPGEILRGINYLLNAEFSTDVPTNGGFKVCEMLRKL